MMPCGLSPLIMCPEGKKLVGAVDDETLGLWQVRLQFPSHFGLLGEEGLEPWPTISTMILRLLLALNFFPSIQVTGKHF